MCVFQLDRETSYHNFDKLLFSQPELVTYEEPCSSPYVGLEPTIPGLKDGHIDHSYTAPLTLQFRTITVDKKRQYQRLIFTECKIRLSQYYCVKVICILDPSVYFHFYATDVLKRHTNKTKHICNKVQGYHNCHLSHTILPQNNTTLIMGSN